MDTVIKVKGITRRWLINVMLTIVLGVIIAETAFGFFIYSYYCSLARSKADSYARFFAGLSYSSSESFAADALDYIDQFRHTDFMQVQIINSEGKIIADTKSIKKEASPMPDYEMALTSEDSTGSYMGEDSDGDKIMAETFILSDRGFGANGAVRWVIPMAPIYRDFMVAMGIAIAFGAVLIVFVSLSGRYFNRSIVAPVKEVSSTARRIALGDFKARLEVKESDEIGELCDTINYMANELSQAENMKNDFISSLSHELRTPLTAIKGWGETAKLSLDGDRELVGKGLEVILNEAERLQGLVEELLDFSRLQTGRFSVNMATLDIAEVIDESAEMYDELARRQNILMKIIRPRELPLVLGDRDRLKQVFINIIDNAVKYSPSGGRVNIKVSVEEGFIRTLISDTGLGIPEKDIDRVKEKFYKANKTVRGSGIGLAVADEIIKQHNGLIFLESEENKGTTVTVVLPTIAEAPAGEQPIEIELPPDETSV